MQKTTFAHNLRQRRKAKNLTQFALAQRLFVSPRTISLWETGKTHPDEFNINRLAAEFDLPPRQIVDEIFGGNQCD